MPESQHILPVLLGAQPWFDLRAALTSAYMTRSSRIPFWVAVVVSSLWMQGWACEVSQAVCVASLCGGEDGGCGTAPTLTAAAPITSVVPLQIPVVPFPSLCSGVLVLKPACCFLYV